MNFQIIAIPISTNCKHEQNIKHFEQSQFELDDRYTIEWYSFLSRSGFEKNVNRKTLLRPPSIQYTKTF